MSVGPEQQIALRADCLADLPAERLRKLEPLEARLARIEIRIAARRIELDRGETHRGILGGALGGEVGITVDRGIAMRVAFGGTRIKISVGAQPLVHLAAQQLIDGLVERLAHDVPAGHLEPAEHAHQGDVGPQRITTAVDIAPQGLDPEGIGAEHMMLENILDHRDNDLRCERRRIDLANAFHAAVGDQL